MRYDLLAVTADDDFFKAGARAARYRGLVKTMLEARVDTVTAEFGGVKESVQLVVVPDNADLSAYMKTEDASKTTFLAPATGGEELALPREGNGALITKNVEQVLGFWLGRRPRAAGQRPCARARCAVTASRRTSWATSSS